MSRERYEPIDLNVYRGNEGEGHFRNMLRVDNYLRDLSDRRATETHGGGGGGGGAPTDADYLVLSANATLTDERILAVTSPIQKADTGAGGTLTISINQAGIDHGSLNATSLLDDDHPQYLLVADVGTIDHNALTNLAVGDVHTQYLLVSGGRQLSGDWVPGLTRTVGGALAYTVASGDTDITAGVRFDESLTAFQANQFFFQKLTLAGIPWLQLYCIDSGGGINYCRWNPGQMNINTSTGTGSILLGPRLTPKSTWSPNLLDFSPTAGQTSWTYNPSTPGLLDWNVDYGVFLHDDDASSTDPIFEVRYNNVSGSLTRPYFRLNSQVTTGVGTALAATSYGLTGSDQPGAIGVKTILAGSPNDLAIGGAYTGTQARQWFIRIQNFGTGGGGADQFDYSDDNNQTQATFLTDCPLLPATHTLNYLNANGSDSGIPSGVTVGFTSASGHGSPTTAWTWFTLPQRNQIPFDGISQPSYFLFNNSGADHAVIFDTVQPILGQQNKYVFLVNGTPVANLGGSASFTSRLTSYTNDDSDPEISLRSLSTEAIITWDVSAETFLFDHSISTDELTLTSATPLFLTADLPVVEYGGGGASTVIYFDANSSGGTFGQFWRHQSHSVSLGFIGNATGTLMFFQGGQGSVSTTAGNLVLSASDSGTADLELWAKTTIILNAPSPGPGTADVSIYNAAAAVMLGTDAGTNIINLNSPTDCLEQTAPSAPAANTLRLFNSNVTGELSVIDSGSTVTSLMGGGVEPVPFATEVDDAGAGVTYIGEAAAGTATSAALWRIKKMTETGPDISIIWADGDTDQDNIWDNRASLSYS